MDRLTHYQNLIRTFLTDYSELLKAPRPVLFVEIHPGLIREHGHEAVDVIRFLHEHGYRAYRIPDGSIDDLPEQPDRDFPVANTTFLCRPDAS